MLPDAWQCLWPAENANIIFTHIPGSASSPMQTTAHCSKQTIGLHAINFKQLHPRRRAGQAGRCRCSTALSFAIVGWIHEAIADCADNRLMYSPYYVTTATRRVIVLCNSRTVIMRGMLCVAVGSIRRLCCFYDYNNISTVSVHW